MLQRHSAPLLAFLLLLTLPAYAQEPGTSFNGEVAQVKDGDTFDVTDGGRTVTVRLHGVDAPESGQAFGEAATERAAELAHGKVARVSVEVRLLLRFCWT